MRQSNYCHLDVKPDNFIVTGDGIIKGIDFGLSCKVKQSTSPKTQILYGGSPFYMAPEIRALKNIYEEYIVDPWKADIYSLGITLLALIYQDMVKFHLFFPFKICLLIWQH